MIGDVAATIGLDNLTAETIEFVEIHKEVLTRCALARGDRVWMLQEQEVIRAALHEGPLNDQRIGVRDTAEPPDLEGPLVEGDRGQRTSASQSRVSMISLTRCMKAAA